MSFRIQIPTNLLEERKYALRTILSDFLGISYSVNPAERQNTAIQLDGKSLEIEDSFFIDFGPHWLQPKELPKAFSNFDFSQISPALSYLYPSVPVLFGKEPRLETINPNEMKLRLDIFGNIFFLLTRYEEMIIQDRDEHGRFPFSSSILRHENFIERPLVNEYLEIFWTCLRRLWPDLKRKERKFKILPSHDVDLPFRFNIKGLPDSYNTFQWIMDESEKSGLRSTFNFLAGGNSRFEKSYSLKSSRIQQLMHNIHKRHHSIGFHPSYESMDNQEIWAQELKTLQEEAPQPILGGRQHYLRFKNPNTWRLWDRHGMTYDSTQGFAEQPGFKAGICYDYPVFDLENRKPLKLRESPLILMDASLLERKYLGFRGVGENFSLIQKLKSTCEFFQGDFHILWHNSRLNSRQKRYLYRSAISSN